MTFTFFDCETTKVDFTNWQNHASPSHPQWGHLLQLGGIVTDAQGKQLEEFSFFVKPKGFTVGERGEGFDNITQAQLERDGQELESVVGYFKHIVAASNYVVCHNLPFDKGTMNAAAYRCNQAIYWPRGFCTNLLSRNELGLDNGKGYGYSLKDLYFHLFGESFIGHDALADGRATARCFWGMEERTSFIKNK